MTLDAIMHILPLNLPMFSHPILLNLLRGVVPLVIAASTLAAVPQAVILDDYAPLRKGIEWIMDAELTSPTGEKTKATAHRAIGELVERNGKSYNRSRTWMEGGPAPFEVFKLVRKDATGFYSLSEGDPNAREEIEELFPLKVGSSWEKPMGSIMVSHTVMALETVTINGKVYENCFHVRVTSPDHSYTEDYYDAPNVGSVKSDMAFKGAGAIKLTLREFKSAQP